jgi:hypothetical protein
MTTCLVFLLQHAGTLPMILVLVVILFFSIVTSIVVNDRFTEEGLNHT